MPRDTVDPKLFSRLMTNSKLKETSRQTARVLISRIHQENPGITMNAAAYLYAQRKGIGIYGYLGPEDKLSLTYKKQQPVQLQPSHRGTKPTRAISGIPDLDSPLSAEALRNASAYPYVYIWENLLRTVILEKYGMDSTWWNDSRKVSNETQEYANRIATAERKYPWIGSRGNHPIYYVGLVELFGIIERNWGTFKDVFGDLEQLRAWTKECAPIRNLIAHNIQVGNVDITNVRIKAIYLWRTISKSQLK